MIGVATSRLLFAGLCVCSSATLLRADVFAEAIQQLEQLSFTSSAGSVVFIGSNNGTVTGTASDSLSGQSQQTQSGTGPLTFDVSTPPVIVNNVELGGAVAVGSADASKLTSDNAAVVALTTIAESGAARATNTLTGTIEIVGATGPATLNVSAVLSGVGNFLATDAFGLSASSEVLFSVSLSNGDTPVFFDNLESVSGPNQQKNFNFNQTLTGTSVLQAGTSYTFTAVEDSIVNGSNSATVTPEPSYLILSIVLLSGLITVRRWKGRPT
jgi:hypothetical protein